jgi:hypothetical protein
MDETLKTIKLLISENQTEEALTKFSKLLENIEGLGNYRDELLVIKPMWLRLEKEWRLGLKTNDDLNIMRNRVNYSLIDLIKKVQANNSKNQQNKKTADHTKSTGSSDLNFPSDSTPIIPSKGKSKNNRGILFIICSILIIASVSLISIWKNSQENKDISSESGTTKVDMPKRKTDSVKGDPKAISTNLWQGEIKSLRAQQQIKLSLKREKVKENGEQSITGDCKIWDDSDKSKWIRLKLSGSYDEENHSLKLHSGSTIENNDFDYCSFKAEAFYKWGDKRMNGNFLPNISATSSTKCEKIRFNGKIELRKI